MYDKYHHRWYKKRKNLAAKNPIWAEIETRRQTGTGNTTLFLSTEQGLGWEEFETQQKIENDVKPHTIIHKTKWWLDKHGPTRIRGDIKQFYQRGRRGWADYDAYNMSFYLARVIAEAAEHIAAHSYSHPVGSTHEEWTTAMVDMADGFRAYLALDDNYDTEKQGYGAGSAYRARQDALEARVNAALEAFTKHFYDLWD